MDAQFFIYRLVDSEYPTITRYVGCTDNPKRREFQHASYKTTTSLVRPWSAWLAGLGRTPVLEVIAHVTGTLQEARREEARHIALNAVDNKWLLNASEWRQDKVQSGVPDRVVSAYKLAVSHGRFSDGYEVGHPLDTIAQHLERQYPRLKLFQYRYMCFAFNEEEATVAS